MNAAEFLHLAWDWPPAMVPGAALLLAASWANWRAGQGQGALNVWRWGWWAAGLAVFLLSLVSPVGVLAEHYLFSAHMLQHLSLLLVVPALCLLGWPKAHARVAQAERAGALPRTAPVPGRRDLRMAAGNRDFQRRLEDGWFCARGRARLAAERLGHPFLAWTAGIGAMWLWHAPALCNAATASQSVRSFQTVSLLVLGTWFWWPIIGPQGDRRLAPLAGVLYLFTACLACTLLGIFITFTPLRMCSIYDHPIDPLGALPLLRQQWGLTPAVDQQLGGLIMWVPACLIYLTGILSLLVRWFAGHDTTRTTSLAGQHA